MAIAQKPITPIGIDLYRQEFKLMIEERQFWVKEKERAACLGDRSENAEYVSAKEMIRNLDRRLRYIQSLLQTVRVIDPSTIPNKDVRFGKKIVFDDNSYLVLVGSHELSLFKNSISNHAPIGKALLGKTVGDRVKIGKDQLEIVEIVSITKGDVLVKD